MNKKLFGCFRPAYCLMLCLTMLFVHNALFAQSRVKVDFANTPLIKVLESISQQSNYRFIYTNELDVNGIKVSVASDNESVTVLFNKLFNPIGVGYVVKGNQVVLAVKATGKSAASNGAAITGKVTDETGEPLVGVGIQNENTKDFASTDIAGNYTIRANVGDKLVFTYIGTETFTAVVGSRGVVNAVMKTDVIALENVVVTGYQTISRERATGSFDIIQKAQIDKPAVDLSSRMIGSAAGVVATVAEDGSASYLIRGSNNFSKSGSSPLVVVDGFPIEGGFETINPNDVESVSILKDAAAASIWGARAANGVIVVTTKRALKEEKLKISFNAFLKVRGKMDLDYVNPVASSADHIEYEKMMFGKYGVSLTDGNLTKKEAKSAYTLAQIAMNEARLGNISEAELDARLKELSGIDYKDDVYKYLLQNPFTQQYNLTVSGGGDKMRVYASMMYENDRKHYVGDKSDKYTLNMRANSNIAKWLKFDVSAMFQYRNSKDNDITIGAEIKQLSPYERLVNGDGSYANVVKDYYIPAIQKMASYGMPYDWDYNPLRDMRSVNNSNNSLNGRFQAALTFNIIEGLTYTPSFQYEISDANERELYLEDSYEVRDMVNYYTEFKNNVVGLSAYPKGAMLDNAYEKQQGYVLRNQLSFNRTFGKHGVNVIAGTEIRHKRTTTHDIPRTYGYDDETLTSALFPNGTGKLSFKDAFGSTIKIEDYLSEYSYSTDRFFSLYANGAYTFNNKYTVSGSFRTDASNFITDDPKYRYAPFWSVGAMWNIGKEGFMKEADFIDRLNLRATFGYNGNVNTSTSFEPLISYGDMNVDRNEIPVGIASYGNPTLRWERVRTLDIGVDFSFWRGKLSGKMDFYDKYSTDLIIDKSMPALYGSSTSKVNAGEMSNRGFELELGSVQRITSDISWYGNFTYAYNKNRIEKLYRQQTLTRDYLNGQPIEGCDISSVFAWKYAGLNDDGIPSVWYGNEKKAMTTTLGSDNITDPTIFPPVGVTVAPHNMGLSTGFKIYDFDLSMIVVGKFGHVFKRPSFMYNTMGSTKMSVHKDVAEFLSGDSKYPPLLTDENNANQSYFGSYYVDQIDYIFHSANHIRFHELNLTYNIPQAFLQKIRMQSASIYAQVNNLGIITFNDYKNDPEFPEGKLKPERTFIVGLKFNF